MRFNPAWLFRHTQDPVGLDEPFLKGGVTKEDMFPQMIVSRHLLEKGHIGGQPSLVGFNAMSRDNFVAERFCTYHWVVCRALPSLLYSLEYSFLGGEPAEGIHASSSWRLTQHNRPNMSV